MQEVMAACCLLDMTCFNLWPPSVATAESASSRSKVMDEIDSLRAQYKAQAWSVVGAGKDPVFSSPAQPC